MIFIEIKTDEDEKTFVNVDLIALFWGDNEETCLFIADPGYDDIVVSREPIAEFINRLRNAPQYKEGS